jgi:hypothetical protein
MAWRLQRQKSVAFVPDVVVGIRGEKEKLMYQQRKK